MSDRSQTFNQFLSDTVRISPKPASTLPLPNTVLTYYDCQLRMPIFSDRTVQSEYTYTRNKTGFQTHISVIPD